MSPTSGAPSIEVLFAALPFGLEPTTANLFALYGGVLFVNCLIVLVLTRLRGYSEQGTRSMLALITVGGLLAVMGPFGFILGMPVVLGSLGYAAFGRPL